MGEPSPSDEISESEDWRVTRFASRVSILERICEMDEGERAERAREAAGVEMLYGALVFVRT